MLCCAVHYKECPHQTNGHNCRKFAVAIVLHLTEQIVLHMDSFSQDDVSKAKSQLAEVFTSRSGVMTSNIFRNCFPSLCDGSIIESTGEEVLTHVTDYPQQKVWNIQAQLQYKIILLCMNYQELFLLVSCLTPTYAYHNPCPSNHHKWSPCISHTPFWTVCRDAASF